MFNFCVCVGKGSYILSSYACPYLSTADIDLATITDRMAVKKAVQSGNVEDAIEKVNDLNPEVGFPLFMYLILFLLLLYKFTLHIMYALFNFLPAR